MSDKYQNNRVMTYLTEETRLKLNDLAKFHEMSKSSLITQFINIEFDRLCEALDD